MAWSAQFCNVAHLFQKFLSKKLILKNVHLQQLFFAVVWSQIRENVINHDKKLSVEKAVKPYNLKYRFQVQVLTAVNVGYSRCQCEIF